MVLDSMKEFSKDQYHIDVIKAEIPVNWDFVEGYTKNGNKAVYSQDEVKKIFQDMNSLVDRPFIYLSAGVPAETFRAELTFAGEAGNNYSGILGGRATWLDGVEVYAKDGKQALIDWLNGQGKENVEELNDILNKYATPWYEVYGGLDNIEVFDRKVMTD